MVHRRNKGCLVEESNSSSKHSLHLQERFITNRSIEDGQILQLLSHVQLSKPTIRMGEC